MNSPVFDQHLPALSIRQPWCHFILHCGKRHENRDWSERYPAIRFRGDFLIHAAKGMTRDEYMDACEFAWRVVGLDPALLPKMTDLPRGGIVGRARVVAFVDDNDFPSSPWYMGPGAIVLEDVQPLPFTPCKGYLYT